MTTAQQIPQVVGEPRDRIGSRYAARLRQQGRLPAVIYGMGREPQHVAVDARTVTDLLQHHSHVMEVQVGGQPETCLVKDVQWDHLGDKILHLDLARFDLKKKVTVTVGIEFVNETDAPGLKEDGAMVQHQLDSIEVECLATDIPESIRVDLSGLTTDSPVTLAQVPMPSGVIALTEPDAVVASITIVAEEPEEEQAPADEGAEPEVIGKADQQEGEGEPSEG